MLNKVTKMSKKEEKISISSLVRVPDGRFGIVLELTRNAWAEVCKVKMLTEESYFYLHDISKVRFSKLETINNLCEVL